MRWSCGRGSDVALLQRIAGITAMLQQSLEGLLLEGLQTSDVDIIRHCLRTYATIDKTRDAEALVGQVLVKPYVDEVRPVYVESWEEAGAPEARAGQQGQGRTEALLCLMLLLKGIIFF